MVAAEEINHVINGVTGIVGMCAVAMAEAVKSGSKPK